MIPKGELKEIAESIENIPQEIKKQMDTNLLNNLWKVYKHLMEESEESDEV